jgi:hypothetical protein
VIEFLVIFDDRVRKRHYHETERGKVTRFVVQLEVKVREVWRVVVRYDCSHGFAHVDNYDFQGRKKKRPIDLSLDSALTYADWDIKENWLKYRDAFLKGVSDG